MSTGKWLKIKVNQTKIKRMTMYSSQKLVKTPKHQTLAWLPDWLDPLTSLSSSFPSGQPQPACTSPSAGHVFICSTDTHVSPQSRRSSRYTKFFGQMTVVSHLWSAQFHVALVQVLWKADEVSALKVKRSHGGILYDECRREFTQVLGIPPLYCVLQIATHTMYIVYIHSLYIYISIYIYIYI